MTSAGDALTTAMWEDAPCGLLVLSTDGTIRRVNDTFAGWLGYSKSDLEGARLFQDCLTAGGRIFHQTHWAPLLHLQGSVAEVKLEVVTADGKKTPMLMNAVRRRHGNEEFDHLALMIVRERHEYERELVTARRNAEEALAARMVAESNLQTLYDGLAEAGRHKDEFLAILAHELRNPLAAIRSALEMLADGNLRVEVAARMQAIVTRQVRQLSRLVDDLLDVARINRGHIEIKHEPVELRTVFVDVLETYRPLFGSCGIALRHDVEDTALDILGDAARMEQLLGNLLNNAMKFTNAGGTVTVTLKKESDHALLVVRDTGIGITSENLPRLFQLFVQVRGAMERSQGGLGIGLMLVKFITEKHGGQVLVHSEGVGHGTTFEVRLPLSTIVRPDERAATVHDTAATSIPRRILLVDDSEDGAASMAEYLRHHGHRVTIAHTGEIGLDLFRTHEFDVLVLDIGLPGIDGYEVARRIRADRRGSPLQLIALTGWGQPSDMALSKAAGFDLHLVKPISPRDLLAAIDAQLIIGSGP
jgi:PAS domain S-box-containing protein